MMTSSSNLRGNVHNSSITTNLLDIDSSNSNITSLCNYIDCDEYMSLYKTSSIDKFCVMHINCRSLAANFSAVSDIIVDDLKCSLDVIVITETWLQDNCAVLYNIPGYKMYHHQRDNARGGGDCIYVRDFHNVQPIDLKFNGTTSFEHFQLTLCLNTFPITIAAVYRPPNSSLHVFLYEFTNYVENLCLHNTPLKPTVYIAGDFNINLLSSDSNTSVSDILDTMNSFGFFPSILKPTRIANSSAILIDNIFINNPLFSNAGLLNVDISDHLPIFAILDKFSHVQDKCATITNNASSPSLKRNFRPNNVNNFSIELQNCTWDFVTEQSDVNEDYSNFLTLFLNKFNVSFSEVFDKSKPANVKPWMTSAILISCKHKQKLYRQKVQGFVMNRIYKNYKNTLTNIIKRTKINYLTNIINQHKKNSKALWNLINSQIGRSTSNSSTLDHINSNVLNDFFVNLGTNTTKNIKHPRGNVFATVRQPLLSPLFLAPTSSNEIISIVSKLAPKLSTSFDNISVKLLKQIILQIANPLSKIFNKSLSHGIFPDLLKIARIIPIFKRGDSSDPKNYRPISLLPSFYKILEQIIYNRLISFFNKHDILHSSQHGFRTSHSTNSAIAEVLDCVTLALNKKLLSLALFIDVSKAFDSLDY